MKGKREYFESLKQEVKLKLESEGIENFSKIMQNIRQKYAEDIKKFGIKDPEQSWKPFKGKLLEDVLLDYLKRKLQEFGFGVIKGSDLEKEDNRLEECLSMVKRGIVVDFGEFGMHLPDADIVIYDPKNCKPVAIISSKTTLRERIAQTGYWKLKLSKSEITKGVKVFFITLDEDGDLHRKIPSKKGRAIAETDTDGTYVITPYQIEESNRVKSIEKFLEDFKKIIKTSNTPP